MKLKEWGKSPSVVDAYSATNWDECLTILTESLFYSGLKYLRDLDATALDLVSGIHKKSTHGDYLLILMVGALISVKNFLSLDWSLPGLPPVIDTNIAFIERYPSLWTSVKQNGTLNSE